MDKICKIKAELRLQANVDEFVKEIEGYLARMGLSIDGTLTHRDLVAEISSREVGISISWYQKTLIKTMLQIEPDVLSYEVSDLYDSTDWE